MVTPDFSLGEDQDEHIRAGVKSVVDQYKQLDGVIYCHGKNVDNYCDLDIITASFAQNKRPFGSADIVNALQLMGMFGDQVARHQFGASAVELLQPDTADGQNNKRKSALDKIKDSIDRFVDAGVLMPLEEKQVPTFKNPLASRHKSADVFQLVQESNDDPALLMTLAKWFNVGKKKPKDSTSVHQKVPGLCAEDIEINGCLGCHHRRLDEDVKTRNPWVPA